MVAIFANYLAFFPNLKILVIDFPTRLQLKQALKPEDYAKHARNVRTGDWWNEKIAPFLPVGTKRSFIIKVVVLTSYDDKPGYQEARAPRLRSGDLLTDFCR